MYLTHSLVKSYFDEIFTKKNLGERFSHFHIVGENNSTSRAAKVVKMAVFEAPKWSK